MYQEYTWPGSNRRPSACEANVIATRPQVRRMCNLTKCSISQTPKIFSAIHQGCKTVAMLQQQAHICLHLSSSPGGMNDHSPSASCLRYTSAVTAIPTFMKSPRLNSSKRRLHVSGVLAEARRGNHSVRRALQKSTSGVHALGQIMGIWLLGLVV